MCLKKAGSPNADINESGADPSCRLRLLTRRAVLAFDPKAAG
jgi:hypothetical protein